MVDEQILQKEKLVSRPWRNSRTSRMREKNLRRPAPIPNESFPSLPTAVVEEKPWRVTQWGNFRFPDNIQRLEARACFLALREKLRDPRCHGMRNLNYCDNLSFVLAFGKGRSRDFGTLSIQRKFSAMLFATMTTVRMRWLEGLRNPADEPSRRRSHSAPL